MRFNPNALPPHMRDKIPPADRKALGIESTDEHAARMDVECERDLQRECEAYLKLQEPPIKFDHRHSRSRDHAGWPDLSFPLYGRFVAVELKAKNGKLSDDQKKCLDALARNGAQCHVVRTFAQFRAIVQGRGLIIPEETQWKTQTGDKQ